MKLIVFEQDQDYDGTQLATAFVAAHAAQASDAALLFEGAADVPIENMVDTEDVENDRPIASARMAHVIIYHRDMPLAQAVLAQRLLGRLAADWIRDRAGQAVHVRGDDLFVGEGKLSVSIATRCPTGSLIHFGVNIETEGTPVRTAGLRELRLKAGEFLRAVGRSYCDEIASARHAESKVRDVS